MDNHIWFAVKYTGSAWYPLLMQKPIILQADDLSKQKFHKQRTHTTSVAYRVPPDNSLCNR